MITICSRWETTQMPAALEWRMWRQLRGAFGINRFVFTPVLPEMLNVSVDQYATMEEALASCDGIKVFLEPTAPYSLTTWRDSLYGRNVTFVLGNTEQSNLPLVGSEDYAIHIDTPGKTDLYGISAAAIALAYWYGQ